MAVAEEATVAGDPVAAMVVALVVDSERKRKDKENTASRTETVPISAKIAFRPQPVTSLQQLFKTNRAVRQKIAQLDD